MIKNRKNLIHCIKDKESGFELEKVKKEISLSFETIVQKNKMLEQEFFNKVDGKLVINLCTPEEREKAIKDIDLLRSDIVKVEMGIQFLKSLGGETVKLESLLVTAKKRLFILEEFLMESCIVNL